MFDCETAELEHRIARRAADLAAGMAGWLELVAEFDRREAYLAHDCISTADWLGWRCGVTKHVAREHVRVARRLEDLPIVAAKFREGSLSYSKVRALVRSATEATENSLVELAVGTSASQLERICSSLRRSLSIDDEQIAYERRHLSYFWEDDGSLSLHGLLSGEEGALFIKALELARETLHRSEADAPGQLSNADAVTAMAEAFLANGSAGSHAADRHKVIVHVDRDALSGDLTSSQTTGPSVKSGSAEPLSEFEGPASQIEDGPPITHETARRLACDASIVEMSSVNGEPLSVGRARRTVPPAIRTALARRDGCCRYPGCTNRLYVDAHHVHHWADGGETSVGNLLLLCRRHHRLLHEGAYRLVQSGPDGPDLADTQAEHIPVDSGGEVRFVRPNGIVIEPAPAVPRSHPEEIVNANRASGIDPGSTALNARFRGQRLDLHFTIGGLCDREARGRAPTEQPPGTQPNAES